MRPLPPGVARWPEYSSDRSHSGSLSRFSAKPGHSHAIIIRSRVSTFGSWFPRQVSNKRPLTNFPVSGIRIRRRVRLVDEPDWDRTLSRRQETPTPGSDGDNETWKKIAIGAGAVVLLAIIVGITVHQSGKNVVTVQTGKVQRQDLSSVVSASGEIKAEDLRQHRRQTPTERLPTCTLRKAIT